MQKYGILVLALAIAAVGALLFMQHRATTPSFEHATDVLSSPHDGGNFGQAGTHSGEVIETMNAGGYTYVHVDTGNEKIWAAGPETVVKVGDRVSFVAGMEMTDFRSESLDRTFPSVYFVDAINTGDNTMVVQDGHPPIMPAPGAGDMDFSGIRVPSGGKSIADVYAQRDALAGKTVVVRGKVVKFTGDVMGKNWIHLRDGTGSAGTDDLTVTTDGVARVGDVITVRGQVSTDQDFGFGYDYDVIVEDAVVTVDT